VSHVTKGEVLRDVECEPHQEQMALAQPLRAAFAKAAQTDDKQHAVFAPMAAPSQRPFPRHPRCRIRTCSPLLEGASRSFSTARSSSSSILRSSALRKRTRGAAASHCCGALRGPRLKLAPKCLPYLWWAWLETRQACRHSTSGNEYEHTCGCGRTPLQLARLSQVGSKHLVIGKKL
jgi:hypothetical protein